MNKGDSRTGQDTSVGFWGLLSLLVSLLAILSLGVSTFAHLGAETMSVIQALDLIVCVFFLIEFFVGILKSSDRIDFLKKNWIDLIASIPSVDYARLGRLLRVVRLIRVFRAAKTVFKFRKLADQSRIGSALGSAGFIAVFSVFLGAMGVLQFEDAPESNIKTAGDALWWAYSTVTTVGYGDRYPVTTEGRIIGAILMTIGVGTFGILTASVSAIFVGSRESDKNR